MRIIRYQDSHGQTHYGALGDDGTLTGAIRLEGCPFAGTLIPTRQPADVAKLLAPVVPSCIIGIGLNYRAHAAETGKPLPTHPMVFVKLPGCLAHPGDPIYLPRRRRSDQVDYEAELAVVIGRTARNVAAADALQYVLGFTAANDVSARDWQYLWGGGQFCGAKSFDGFCPLGPTLVTTNELDGSTGKLAYSSLRIGSTLNGQTVQDSSTSDLLFGVPELIAFLSGSTTLLPGTVILTGTPSGVGHARKPARYLQAGDVIRVSIEGIGTLTNTVVEEPLVE